MTVEEIFKTPIFLAPMAGVTDSAFRIIVRELVEKTYRKNLLMFSEMVSCNGIHYRNEKFSNAK
ncbi:MAG: tRNA-dihydrouridine synthase [Selenomonadaceae bacterium]|nr:tRNA-dihydrouridine synthase [Selenomonadaceae bacterium]